MIAEADGLTTEDLRRLVIAYTSELSLHEERINRINVFPVADADTGSNMVGTMRAVVDAMSNAPDELPGFARVVRRAALMGARGNSGIILSQWLRGFFGELSEGGNPVSPPRLADALQAASEAAYGAVESPREGTILTVARMAAEATLEPHACTSVASVWSAAARGGDEALDRSTELLEVLRRHEVVDSGAYGLSILFDVASGAPVQERGEGRVGSDDGNGAGPESGGSRERFEVTLLLETTDIGGLREAWSRLGDSVDISGGDDGDPFACHVHTCDVDAVIAAASASGRAYRVRVMPLPLASSVTGAG